MTTQTADEPGAAGKAMLPEAIAAAFRSALDAAAAFRGATAPNPAVGCAVLDGAGRILAVAAHQRAGGPHAEAAALDLCRIAGDRGRIHTIVVTLEPCNHHGRTPPCTDAILATSAATVWIGAHDPNPRVTGGGAARLRAAGRRVHGLAGVAGPVAAGLALDCAALLAPFAKRVTTGRPWVTVKQALDPDGSMIPPPGRSTFTSGPALDLAHRLRRRADAVLTGSGTILADHPAFTVRRVPDHPGRRRTLAILDRRGRVTADDLASAGQAFDVVIERDLDEALDRLGRSGALEVLVEAGPAVTSSVLERRLWDEHLIIRNGRGAAADRVELVRREGGRLRGPSTFRRRGYSISGQTASLEAASDRLGSRLDMSRLEHAIGRLQAGEPVVLIDEDRPDMAHLVSADAAAPLQRIRGLAVGPIERVFDPATRPANDAGPVALSSRPAAPNGVLGRPGGPAEAAVDVLRLAGRPAALLARLDLPGGVLADETAAERLARREGLAVLSIQDVIAHRLARETIVDREASARLPSAYATQALEIQAFRGRLDGIEHVAMVHGPLGETPLVRLHSECLTGDAFGSLRCDCGDQLREALRRIGEDPQGGVVVYLRGQEGRGIGLVDKIRAYALQDLGRDTVEANEDLGFAADLRDYGIAVQILRQLGVERLRLLSNNGTKAKALERYGIRVVERLGIAIPPNRYNAAYLETKRVKMGHDLRPALRAAAE